MLREVGPELGLAGAELRAYAKWAKLRGLRLEKETDSERHE